MANIKKNKTTGKTNKLNKQEKSKKVAVKKDAESKKKSIKEIDIGTGVITGEEVQIPKTDKPKTEKAIKKKKQKKTAVKKDDKVFINKDVNSRSKKKKVRKKYYTHDGHELTLKEYKFIDNYIATGNVSQSVIQAGYTSKAPGVYGNDILHKKYIADEVDHRMTVEHSNRIASGQEVMEFFTKVMNGEIKDQFELDAPLSERLKAANELAKRTVDIATKVAGVTQGNNEVTIKLDWSRRNT